LEIASEFLNFTKVELNPLKYAAFKYTGTTDGYVLLIQLADRRSDKIISLHWVNATTHLNTLTCHLVKTKIGQSMYMDGLFEKSNLLLERLKMSGLKATQEIHVQDLYKANF
jgi:hypothetical protein